MKVLEIMGSLHRGGAETMIMNYYRAFDKEKCQMDFVIHDRFENDYYDEAISLGAKVIELKTPGTVGAVKYIQNLIEVIQKNGPYDAIHIQTDYQAFLSVIAAKFSHIKNIIVHSHNTFFSKRMKFINRIVFSVFSVQRVACGREAGKAFFGNKNFIILNNAIDIEKFRKFNEVECKKNKHKIFGDAQVIGHLGRFNKQKNHDFIIDLAQSLLNTNENIVIACYGEGEEEVRIKNIVKERGLSNIIFMGVTNDVVSVYHMFDIFILPSLFEGFPVTLIESQLTGVYSLTSDKVSHKCDLGFNALKFLPLDVSVWKHEILEYLKSNTKKKNPTIENIDEFDVNVQWKKLYQIYKGEYSE